MLFGDIETALAAVTGTRSRLAKVDALAQLLRGLAPDEIVPAVGILTASPRQGRLGVGWKTLSSRGGEHADTPSLTVSDVDEAFDRLVALGGSGSAAQRTALLDEVAGRATAAEWHLLVRVMTGELRTGALEGVLLDAVARASDRDGAAVRRAAMLSGDLGGTALVALTGSDAELDAVGLVVGPRRAAHARLDRHLRRGGAARRGARLGGVTSSTARACRCTARATRCTCTPAPSPTSPTASPRSWRS